MNATPKPIGSPVGLHRVVSPAGVLPQAAQVLDTAPTLWPDEVKIAVERLNLDAASFRQLWNKHQGNGAAVREEVLEIVKSRGKMQNPVTGSGGMLVGVVEEVGPDASIPVKMGDREDAITSLSGGHHIGLAQSHPTRHH